MSIRARRPPDPAAIPNQARLTPWVVGGAAASVILTEIALTRLFSVLLFYHYSFLAVALALFGLAAGSLSAAHELGRADPASAARHSLVRASMALLLLVPVLAVSGKVGDSLAVALILAAFAGLPFFFLGKALALALALGREGIHRLYAIDLISSAAACLAAIGLLRWLQGPVVLEAPAFIALLLALSLTPPGARLAPACAAAAVGLVLLLAGTRPDPLIRLADPTVGSYLTERWNSHSRVRIARRVDGRLWFVIDKTAASVIPPTRAPAGAAPPIEASWNRLYPDPSYAVRRQLRDVAIIGVGGGQDVISALANGARRIDGLELNERMIEFLLSGLDGYTAIGRRPELQLMHDEARHALQHREVRYDLIRANLIDTWAATAQGGFVLAENGIYTVEGWRLFLNKLTHRGILATTRWYVPSAPAEAQRLVALAAEALDAEALSPAGLRLIALAFPTPLVDQAAGPVQTITTLVSREPFTSGEVENLERFVTRNGGVVLTAPHRPPRPGAEVLADLLTPATRRAAVNASPWAIAPPTDQRPFFFLQLRPTDLLRFGGARLGVVTRITVSGVRILMLSVCLAILAALVIAWQARRRDALNRPLGSMGYWYFASIGAGYMAVQIALLQRLSLILGHPTATLALVLATMLAGTGLGSSVAGQRQVHRRRTLVLLSPVLAAGVVTWGFPFAVFLDQTPSLFWSAVCAGAVTAGLGVALGVALPTGVRIFASSELAVTQAWAINGAASVVGSATAALGGLLLGSRGLMVAALACYALAFLIGMTGRQQVTDADYVSYASYASSSRTDVVEQT